MDKIYLGIAKRAFRALIAAAVGSGIPLAIQYVTTSTNPWFIAAAPMATAALMGIGKFLRDKYQLPYVPI
jgi:hypothetical protein